MGSMQHPNCKIKRLSISKILIDLTLIQVETTVGLCEKKSIESLRLIELLSERNLNRI